MVLLRLRRSGKGVSSPVVFRPGMSDLALRLSGVTLGNNYSLSAIVGAQYWQRFLFSEVRKLLHVPPPVKPIPALLLKSLPHAFDGEKDFSEAIEPYLENSGLRSAAIVTYVYRQQMNELFERQMNLLRVNPFEKGSYQRSFDDFQDCVFAKIKALQGDFVCESRAVREIMKSHSRELIAWALATCASGVVCLLGMVTLLLIS